jgi:hypothetical protein
MVTLGGNIEELITNSYNKHKEVIFRNCGIMGAESSSELYAVL